MKPQIIENVQAKEPSKFRHNKRFNERIRQKRQEF